MTRTPANSVPACCVAVLLLTPLAAPPVLGQNANDGFDPNVNGNVLAIALQPDGRILVAGAFSSAGAVTRSNVARFLVDGGIDSAFSSDAAGPVRCLAVQPDASILIGGDFTALRGQLRNRIGRVSASGVLDTAFDPNANGAVRC